VSPCLSGEMLNFRSRRCRAMTSISAIRPPAPRPRFHPIPPNLTQCHPRFWLGEPSNFALCVEARVPDELAFGSAAVEKSAEARRLRVVIPKMQNPASSRVVKKCVCGAAVLAVQNEANKIRKHLNRSSIDSKKIFQYHGWVIHRNRSVQAVPFFFLTFLVIERPSG
jgi:hypothetical protein